MRFALVLIGALFASGAPSLYAQEGAHFDCSQAKNPKACEERVAKMKDTARSARAACEGKPGADHDQCMMKEMCAQAKDAARCEAEGQAALARRARIREACKDKRGEELRTCIREQRGGK